MTEPITVPTTRSVPLSWLCELSEEFPDDGYESFHAFSKHQHTPQNFDTTNHDWFKSFLQYFICAGISHVFIIIKMFHHTSNMHGKSMKWIQELSYCKQIVHQLRKQCVDGIYDNHMTLKSRLRVTQGHWKWNHWVDHTKLIISQIIWRWLLSWSWNVGQRSFKVIENGTIWKLGYGFLFAFHSNYGHIFSHFRDIQRQRIIWPWNLSFNVIENSAVRQTMYDSLLVRHCNQSSIWYHFRVIWRWIISWP